MTSQEIAKRFRGRRAGRYKGRPAWQAKCPIHRDRIASLSITEPEPGKSKVNCFAGCNDVDVLASKGLTVGDLYADKRKMTPALRIQIADEERLALLERQHGLAIMAQAILPGERNYWRTVERNIFVKIRWLRDKLEPAEKQAREQALEVQRIIREYGIPELQDCLPQRFP